MTTASTVFTKQAVREQRIPFSISRNTLNQDTILAIKEIEALKSDPYQKVYNNFSDLLKEIREDI